MFLPALLVDLLAYQFEAMSAEAAIEEDRQSIHHATRAKGEKGAPVLVQLKPGVNGWPVRFLHRVAPQALTFRKNVLQQRWGSLWTTHSWKK